MDAQCLAGLSAPLMEERLSALEKLVQKVRTGELPAPQTGTDVNNHIHTTYSFSPYSPASAVWHAWQAGLETCGIMDHDSISGAPEFIAAGEIVGMSTTCGIECRVDFSQTPFAGMRINNPDQKSVVYMALHGVPHTQFERARKHLAPYARARGARNRAMVEKANAYLLPHGIQIEYDREVVPLSESHLGGSVTERHISRAIAQALLKKLGGGEAVVRFIKGALALPIGAKVEQHLLTPGNPHQMYDLLGWIKSELVPKFYVDAAEECPDVREVLALSEEIGAISAYAYLGDVGDSVTGDKRSQTFEDGYLDELFVFLKGLGFRAVTYMPSRNTKAQLLRVRALCEKLDFFQISGEDINSPRQSFVCQAQRDPMFANLYDATWALIAHEKRATRDPMEGMFSKKSISAWPCLEERIRVFSEEGRKMRT